MAALHFHQIFKDGLRYDMVIFDNAVLGSSKFQRGDPKAAFHTKKFAISTKISLYVVNDA